MHFLCICLSVRVVCLEKSRSHDRLPSRARFLVYLYLTPRAERTTRVSTRSVRLRRPSRTGGARRAGRAVPREGQAEGDPAVGSPQLKSNNGTHRSAHRLRSRPQPQVSSGSPMDGRMQHAGWGGLVQPHSRSTTIRREDGGDVASGSHSISQTRTQIPHPAHEDGTAGARTPGYAADCAEPALQ